MPERRITIYGCDVRGCTNELTMEERDRGKYLSEKMPGWSFSTLNDVHGPFLWFCPEHEPEDFTVRCPAEIMGAAYSTLYQCELDEGHEGMHLGHYKNAKPIRWKQKVTNADT